jgi:cytochrome c556
MKSVSIALFVLLSVGSIRAAEALDEKQFQKLMQEIGDTSKRFKTSIENRDSIQLTKDATRLAEIYQQTVPFWEQRKAQDAAKWSKESATASAALASAAKAKDWDKATLHLREVGKNCKTCHDAHREKRDDGTYRIK